MRLALPEIMMAPTATVATIISTSSVRNSAIPRRSRAIRMSLMVSSLPEAASVRPHRSAGQLHRFCGRTILCRDGVDVVGAGLDAFVDPGIGRRQPGRDG